MKKTILYLSLFTLVSTGQASGFGKTMPVYHVTGQGLNHQQVEYLQSKFDLGELKLDEFGALRYTNEKTFLSVPTKTLATPQRPDSEDKGEIVYEGFDFEAIAKIRVPDKQAAAKYVSAVLTNAGALPGIAKAIPGHSRFEVVNNKNDVLADLAIDTTVSYQFNLNDVSLMGPGAKIRASMGPDGKLTQLTHAYRTLVKGGEVDVVDEKEAINRCKTWTTRSNKNNQKKYFPSLVYYAPPLSEKVDTLFPSISCHAIDRNGAFNQVYVVPAAVDASPLLISDVDQKRRGMDKLFDFSIIQPAHAAFGRRDVGSEGTGPCSNLPDTALNIDSFNDRMTADGVVVQFSWLNGTAWEEDWKDPSFSGNDHNWVDDVDMSYWQGHGSPDGFSFAGCSSNDDESLDKDDALWGNRNVEWISLFTCLVLAGDSGSGTWWQRWGPAFDRLHQINSFDTVSYHSAQHGGIFANHMLKNNPMNVRQAWAQASIDDQPVQVIWATMGVVSNTSLINFNDYFWGKGSVGPDIPAGQITAYWRLSGGS